MRLDRTPYGLPLEALDQYGTLDGLAQSLDDAFWRGFEAWSLSGEDDSPASESILAGWRLVMDDYADDSPSGGRLRLKLRGRGWITRAY